LPKFFRRSLHLGEGGETGPDNDLLEQTFERTGVSIMGKRMFDGGERYWPEEAPFHTPVFVLTHQVREPWARPGGTTFFFVNDGIDRALEQARGAADGRDIRIAGGADVVRQYLNAGLVDELHLAVAPIVFGAGTPLLAGLEPDRVQLSIEEVTDSPRATHLRYAVRSA
jgi:dihydrofolate reductase